MNGLDFHNRTRAYFSEIRRKHSNNEQIGPIHNRHGSLLENVNETQKDWAVFY